MEPELGDSMRPARRRRVVLPEPLGPCKAMKSPGRMVRSAGRRAETAFPFFWKEREAFCNWRMGCMAREKLRFLVVGFWRGLGGRLRWLGRELRSKKG